MTSNILDLIKITQLLKTKPKIAFEFITQCNHDMVLMKSFNSLISSMNDTIIHYEIR